MKTGFLLLALLVTLTLACAASQTATPTYLPPPPPTHAPPPPSPAAAATPASTACQAGDPAASPLYDHQIYLTFTSNGLDFPPGEEKRIIEHASVPDGVIGPDGALWVYFVNGHPGQHGVFAARETNDGAWEIVDCVRLDGRFEGNAVDPDITRLADGRYRLVYFLGSFVGGSVLKPGDPHPIYSAISEDGLNFTMEGQLIAVEDVTDPSLAQLPDGSWLLAMAQSGRIVLASSPDGRQFTLTGVILEDKGIPELARLPDGRLALFLSQIYLSQDGGQNWEAQPGRRVPGGGADPSMTADPNGG